MSMVSVSSVIFSLLRRHARAFLAKGLDRRLVLPVVRGRLFGGGAAAVGPQAVRIAAAVAGIVRHPVVLIERPIGGIGIVERLAGHGLASNRVRTNNRHWSRGFRP